MARPRPSEFATASKWSRLAWTPAVRLVLPDESIWLNDELQSLRSRQTNLPHQSLPSVFAAAFDDGKATVEGDFGKLRAFSHGLLPAEHQAISSELSRLVV